MHRYKSSKEQTKVHIVMSLYLVFCFLSIIIISLKSIVFDGQRPSNQLDVLILIILLIVPVCALTWSIWKLLDDPLLGEVSFDSNGVTFYTKLHTIYFPFAECEDIGLTRWVEAGMFSNQNYVKYVYLSKLKVTAEQREYLFQGRSKRRRGKRNMPLYQSEYVLFQFEADLFAEFIRYVPEPFNTKLIDELGWNYS